MHNWHLAVHTGPRPTGLLYCKEGAAVQGPWNQGHLLRGSALHVAAYES